MHWFQQLDNSSRFVVTGQRGMVIWHNLSKWLDKAAMNEQVSFSNAASEPPSNHASLAITKKIVEFPDTCLILLTY